MPCVAHLLCSDTMLVLKPLLLTIIAGMPSNHAEHREQSYSHIQYDPWQ